ncbi:MAG: hypothetical protein R3E02_15805 [Blastomonas sp.]
MALKTGMSTSFAEQFRSGPSLFPHLLDIPNDRVLIAQVEDHEFRNASFLDQRIFTENMRRVWCSWNELSAAGRGLSGKSDFIFHIGHVGSTLISRMLGEIADVFALREPLILRSFAELDQVRNSANMPWPPDSFLPRLDETLAWLARRPAGFRYTLVKATSFVSQISEEIMARSRKSMILTLRPERYIATILAGDASRQELAQLSGTRLLRLHALIKESPWKLWELEEGQRAALAWATEAGHLAMASDSYNYTVLSADFDHFLDNPAQNLSMFARFLEYDVQDCEIARIADGPMMQRYSKAPEHSYSPQLRSQLLAQTSRERHHDIRNAMDWLDDAAARYPAIARAIEFSHNPGMYP